MNVSDETGSHQDSTQCVSIRKVGERPVSEKKPTISVMNWLIFCIARAYWS